MTDHDDRSHLTREPRLRRLLRHYAELARDDKSAWHARVGDWEGGTPTEVSKWHGRLLAADWLELRVAAPSDKMPAAAQCYRATPAGRKIAFDPAAD
jgi:hypothetical protein